MTARKALLIQVAGVAWVFIVYGAYYSVHKPFSQDTTSDPAATWALLRQPWAVSALLDSLLNLLTAGWLAVAGLALGWALLRWLFPSTSSGQAPSLQLSLRQRGVLAMALGLGVIGLAVFLLGLAGLLYGWLIWGLLVLSTVLPLAGRWPLPAVRPALALRFPQGEAGILAAYAGLALLFATLTAATPPAAWDSLVYHLTAPKLYLQEHRIFGGMDVVHFYFPALTEMIFAAAIVVKGDIAAQLVHPLFAGLTLAAVHTFAEKRWGPATAWLSVAVLLSAPSLLTLAGQAYAEWAILLYVFMGFWALVEWRESGEQPWLVLSGTFAGLALGTKYTAAVPVGGLALLLLWQIRGKFAIASQRRGSVLQVLAWWGVAALVASPWYIKNWWFTGNPVYPFLIGGWNWDSWRMAWFTRGGTGLAGDPLRLLLAPWEMTVLGQEGSLAYDATVGPVLLAFLPWAIPALSGRIMAWATFLAGMGSLFWLLGLAQSSLLLQTRLLFPVFPFLALMVAQGLHNAGRWTLWGFRPQPFLNAALLLALGLNLLAQGYRFLADSPLPYLTGAEGREAYLSRRLGGFYAATRSINEQLRPSDRVLFLWEPRSYYCQVPCQPDALLFNWQYELYLQSTPERVLSAWRARGVTHVLLYLDGLRYFADLEHQEVTPEQVRALQRLKSLGLERLDGPGVGSLDENRSQERRSPFRDRYVLYRILEAAGQGD